MRFQVGPYAYTLVISDRQIYGGQGEPLEAVAIEHRRLFIISPTVHPARRAEIARHEIAHCWEFHVPAPRTEEERAQFFAFIGEQFDRDLEAAGGNNALQQMESTVIGNVGEPPAPSAVAPKPQDSAMGSSDRMTCGSCGTETLCGSISHAQPEADASGRFRVLRWFVCDSCGILQTWYQYCRSSGELMGEIVSVPAPRMLRGIEAQHWLKEHSVQDLQYVAEE